MAGKNESTKNLPGDLSHVKLLSILYPIFVLNKKKLMKLNDIHIFQLRNFFKCGSKSPKEGWRVIFIIPIAKSDGLSDDNAQPEFASQIHSLMRGMNPQKLRVCYFS